MPRQSKLAKLPLASLQAEIQRRQELLPKLLKERDELNAWIAELEGSAGEPAPAAQPEGKKPGRKPGRKAKRVKNALSLPEALASVFAGKEKLGVGEAAEAVLATGYKSNSKIFRTIVNQMLLKDKRFKNVGRGEYTLKAAGKPAAKHAKAKPGRKPGRKAKRVKNALGLPDALAAVFADKEKMGIAEAADAVQAAGYKTNSKGFRKMVNKTLCKDNRFKNVGRGEYALKAAEKPA